MSREKQLQSLVNNSNDVNRKTLKTQVNVNYLWCAERTIIFSKGKSALKFLENNNNSIINATNKQENDLNDYNDQE